MGDFKSKEKSRAEQAISPFFSTSKPESYVEVQEVESKAEATTSETPRKKGRPVVNRETKKRYTITLFPSVYNKASAKASEQGKSLSEVVGDFLSEYVQSNRDKQK